MVRGRNLVLKPAYLTPCDLCGGVTVRKKCKPFRGKLICLDCWASLYRLFANGTIDEYLDEAE